MYQINSYLSSVGADWIFSELEKNLWLGKFLNLKLNTRLITKKIRKLDVDAFREEGKKNLSPKFTWLSFAEIVEDQLVAILHVCTYCHKQNLRSKIQAYN